MGSMFLRNITGLQPLYSKSPHVYVNERNIVHIAGDQRDAFVVQIADQQVNKIDCYVAVGSSVEVGEKIGMIRRGSQVDLFLPGVHPDDLLGLRIGQKVTEGETVLLR